MQTTTNGKSRSKFGSTNDWLSYRKITQTTQGERDGVKDTALFFACSHGQLDVVKGLCELIDMDNVMVALLSLIEKNIPDMEGFSLILDQKAADLSVYINRCGNVPFFH